MFSKETTTTSITSITSVTAMEKPLENNSFNRDLTTDIKSSEGGCKIPWDGCPLPPGTPICAIYIEPNPDVTCDPPVDEGPQHQDLDLDL